MKEQKTKDKKTPKAVVKKNPFSTNRKLIDLLHEAKRTISLYSLEYFHAIREALMWLQKCYPNEYGNIIEMVSFIDTEKENFEIRFAETLRLEQERNEIRELSDKHFFWDKLYNERQTLFSNVSTTAALKGIRNSWMMGFCIWLDLAMKLELHILENTTQKVLDIYRTKYEENIAHESFVVDRLGKVSVKNIENVTRPIIKYYIARMNIEQDVYDLIVNDNNNSILVSNYVNHIYK